MGFFSDLFRSRPGREQWETISARLAEELEKMQIGWFEMVLNFPPAGVRITDRVFAGDGELAVKACQLMDVSTIIAKEKYIHPREQEAFLELLGTKVFGTRSEQGNALVLHYRKFAAKLSPSVRLPGSLWGPFAKDLLRYLCGDIPDWQTMSQAMDAVALVAVAMMDSTFLCVAQSFGDSRTEENILAKMLAKAKGR